MKKIFFFSILLFLGMFNLQLLFAQKKHTGKNNNIKLSFDNVKKGQIGRAHV